MNLSFEIFKSTGYSLCSIVFLIFVLVMYASKKKFRNSSNSIFVAIFSLAFLSILLRVGVAFTIYYKDSFVFLNELMCRLYILVCILWETFLLCYILMILVNDSKKEKRILYLFTLLGLVFYFLLFILDLQYDNSIFALSGTIINILYLFSIVLNIVEIILLFIGRKKIKNLNVSLFVLTVIFFVIITLMKIFLDLEIYDLPYFFSIFVTIVYFTVESQDNKLLSEYETAKTDAEISNKIKTEFLMNISHEIRTPMNTILGFSVSLLNENKLTEDVVKRDSRYIHDAGITLLDLINNILDISKLENEEEKIDEREYKLEDIVLELSSVVPTKMFKTDVEFKIELDENLPSKFFGDSNKIYKIILLTLENAIDHTNYGEVKLNVGGKMTENNMFDLEFEIINSGHEMKTENFDKGFNDLITIDGKNKAVIDSVTLGLIIAKRYIELLNGEITFLNEKGRGTRYYIYIKQQVTDTNRIGNILQNNSVAGISVNKRILNCIGKTILVVDDNQLNLSLAKRLLEPYNFIVNTANNGKEAIDLVKDHKYDIIFMDHMMPDMDGIATLKNMKNVVQKIPPTIALTANTYTGLREKYISEGFFDYLPKPIKKRELDKIINLIFSDSNNSIDKYITKEATKIENEVK